jgi:hypothetical protein
MEDFAVQAAMMAIGDKFKFFIEICGNVLDGQGGHGGLLLVP